MRYITKLKLCIEFLKDGAYGPLTTLPTLNTIKLQNLHQVPSRNVVIFDARNFLIKIFYNSWDIYTRYKDKDLTDNEAELDSECFAIPKFKYSNS